MPNMEAEMVHEGIYNYKSPEGKNHMSSKSFKDLSMVNSGKAG